MNFSLLTIALNIFGFLGIVGGAVAIFISNVSKENSAASSELIANLQALRETDKEDFNKRIQILENQHTEDNQRYIDSVKAISILQGQIQTYKDIPLQALADSMKAISIDTRMNVQNTVQIVQTNAEILKTLQNSALIAVTDRDVILNPSQNIVEQTVQHQTVQEKTNN